MEKEDYSNPPIFTNSGANTSDTTGIVYEPWHYRYVGEKFAKEITKRGLTLEEYVAWRRGR